MKTIYTLLLLVLASSAFAEIKLKSFHKVQDGLYLMYFDSTAEKRYVTKSTVVEFSNFIALIEMPISYDGAGTTKMKDHTEGGEEILQILKEKFPKKPLKYVLSTHWHPHSISSVIPFISRGIIVVTSPKNYEVLKTFVDSAALIKYGKHILLVEEDSLLIKGKGNEIIAYKFSQQDYPHVPTEEFVYYHLPKYNIFHSSCMYQRLGGRKVHGKEMVSTRVEDLAAFLTTKNIVPRYLITTDEWFDDLNGLSSGDTLKKMMREGIGMTELEKEILEMPEELLISNTDSVLKYLIRSVMPVSILNSAVYTSLRRQDLRKALSIARIQALYSPANPNSWDTFGEVYYFLGEYDLAKRCERQSRLIDKNYTQAGEESWKKDLEEYKRRWEKK
jgi:hypothetical protein